MARAADQPTWRDPETGLLRRSLSPQDAAPLDLVWAEIPPGARISYPVTAYTFIVDQQLVVIDGGLTIRQGDALYELGAGDCLRFGLPREVTFENTGSVPCRYIVAILRATGSGIRDSNRL